MALHDDCIIYLLAKAYQWAYGDFKKRLQPYGVTPVQHLILEVLWEEDGLSAGDIGRRLILDNATVSGVLDRMSEAGWIRKEPDPEDKRIVRVRLAPKAMDVKASLQVQREAANEEILAPLRIEERMLLKRMLRDLQPRGSGQ
jgi:DNA-binding MarR family transcriptional regulator